MGLYLRPATQDAALAALAERRWTVLAGGTDLYPALGDAMTAHDVLDISGLPGAHAIVLREGHWHIPCAVTWTALRDAPLPPLFDGLKAAAAQVGGRQVQNAGTVVGNLCNASPAADGVPALLVLDAVVDTAGPGGARSIALADFITGPRQTALGPGDLVLGLRVPARPGRTAFRKLGARRYLVISIAMAAVRLEIADGIVADARVAVGACGPVARRLPAVEASLLGAPPDPDRVRPEDFAALAPIEDVRATAAYRRAAAVELVRRAVADLA